MSSNPLAKQCFAKDHTFASPLILSKEPCLGHLNILYPYTEIGIPIFPITAGLHSIYVVFCRTQPPSDYSWGKVWSVLGNKLEIPRNPSVHGNKPEVQYSMVSGVPRLC